VLREQSASLIVKSLVPNGLVVTKTFIETAVKRGGGTAVASDGGSKRHEGDMAPCRACAGASGHPGRTGPA